MHRYKTAVAFVAMLFLFLPNLTAQIRIFPNIGNLIPRIAPKNPPHAMTEDSANEKEEAETVFAPPERRQLQRLSQAQELIEQNRLSDAVRQLGQILESTEDSFYQPDKNKPLHRSLKTAAQELLGKLPAEGRDFYELEYGATARKMLDEAVQKGDLDGIAEVSRAFFHTKAGYEATYLLGLIHLDHNRPLAAALTFNRLVEMSEAAQRFQPALDLARATAWLRAGVPDRGKKILLAARESAVNGEWEIGGRKIKAFQEGEDPSAWWSKILGNETPVASEGEKNWLLYRGNPQRNSAIPATHPLLSLQWAQSNCDDPGLVEISDEIRRRRVDNNILTFPGLMPLAVDNTVLMRTYENLIAIDLETGKRLWETPTDEAAENSGQENEIEVIARMQLQQMILGGQRNWDDASYGRMSSDGSRVFCVEEAALPAGRQLRSLMRGGRGIFINNAALMNIDGTPVAARNRLMAFDLVTGKLVWQVGGAADDPYPLPLADTLFLGSPLPLQGVLYVLAENQGEIRLIALQAESGAMLWSQPLAIAERSAGEEPRRRFAGASPAYAEGILLCPTTNGALVAIELATRSLLWGYCYANENPNERRQMRGMMAAYLQGGDRWIDEEICVAEGKIYSTPLGSNSLYCLNLSDGKLQWKIPRQNAVYLAGVQKGKVLLVARDSVRAVDASSGRPAWDGRAISLGSSLVNARGTMSDGRYFLPLDNGSIAILDLEKGSMQHQVQAEDGRETVGNLVVHRGKILAQGFNYLASFPQRAVAEQEAAEALAKNPNDINALLLQGEILCDQGKKEEALKEYFRRAYALSLDERSRTRLRRAYFDALESNFPQFHSQSEEALALCESAEHRLRLFTILIEQSLQHEMPELVVSTYERAFALDIPLETLFNIDSRYSLRFDRWLQGNYGRLLSRLSGPNKKRMEEFVSSNLKKGGESTSFSQEQKIAEVFFDHPDAQSARDALVSRRIQAKKWLDVELGELRLAGEENIAEGWAKLASFFRAQDQFQSAASILNYLRINYPEKNLIEDRKIEEHLARLPENDPLKPYLKPPFKWPTGKIEITTNTPKTATTINSYGQQPLRFEYGYGPFFREDQFFYDQGRRQLLVRDPLGKESVRISLVSEKSPLDPTENAYYYHQQMQRPVVSLGHLLFIAMQGKLCAINTLQSDSSGGNRLLWTLEGNRSRLNMEFLANNWQLQQMLMGNYSNQFGISLPILGPVTPHYVGVISKDGLAALDPLTGKVLWQRGNVSIQHELFGDEDYLFLLSHHSKTAQVYDTRDGSLLGERKIPRGNEYSIVGDTGVATRTYGPLTTENTSCLRVVGRKLLLQQSQTFGSRLSLYDPWLEKELWKETSNSTLTRYSLCDEDLVVIYEPDGAFRLVRISDGKVIARRKIEPLANAEIKILRLGDAYYLLVHTYNVSGNKNSVSTQPLPGIQTQPIVFGQLYAFNREGEMLWPKPAILRNQHLILSQTAGLPLLVFACQIYSEKSAGQGRYQVSVLLVHKANGKPAYRGEFSNPSSYFAISANEEEKKMTIALQRKNIELVFTDKPLTPEDELSEQDGEKGSSSATPLPGKLLDLFRKSIEEIIPIPKAEEDPFGE